MVPPVCVTPPHYLPVLEIIKGLLFRIDTAVQVGLFMVRGPAATTRLQADPGAEPKLRYLVKGSVPDHGNDAVSDGHREYDYLDWIAGRCSRSS